jgi:polar amino acid transport system substrate-binding protein
MRTSTFLQFVVFCSLISACSPPPEEVAATSPTETPMVVQGKTPDCHFTVGFDAWEPYQYIDVGDQVTGLDIELIKAVLDHMQCGVTFKAGQWVSLLGDLKNGQVDVLLGSSKTAGREEYAYFSQAYRTEEFSLYVLKEDTNLLTINSIASFIDDKHKIGVVADYYYGPEVSMLRDGSATADAFVTALMGEVNVARLLDHNIDGFLEDSFVGASMLRRKALADLIVPQGITTQTGDAHIMFSKQSVSADVVDNFNQALDVVMTGGQYKQILERYRQ